MDEFNSDDQYIYCCGQESLRRNGVALIVNKSPKYNTWVQSHKWQNDFCSSPRQTIQYHSNSCLCPATNAKEAEVERFCEDLQDLPELTPKWCPFRGRECKSRKSRAVWVTGKFDFRVQNEAGQRLTEFCQENTLVLVNTLLQHHKRWLYTWISPDSQYWNQIDYILCSGREALYSQQRQDWELIVAQIMNSLLPNSQLNWRQ